MKKFFTLFAIAILSACETTPIPEEPEPPMPEENTTQTLELALVAVDDNGQSGELIGCGDSIVFVEKTVADAPTEELIQTALEELFDIEDSLYGESGLYNALAPSDVTVDSVTVNGSDVEVVLSGSIISAGTCDDPRIEQQIRKTIEANLPPTSNVTVLFDGADLNEYFDMSGGQE